MWTFFSAAALDGAKVLYLAFPVMFAAALHIAVIYYDLMPSCKVPIDLGRSFRGRRIFGDHKSWRGVLVMVAGSSLGMTLQRHWPARGLELFDYRSVNVELYGALMGLGFVLGELPNSFLKRRCGVAPGGQADGLKYWLFTLLDQVDSVVGGLLALGLVWPPPARVVAEALVLCSLVHIAFNFMFVQLGLKQRAL
jgi:hypothetical protein